MAIEKASLSDLVIISDFISYSQTSWKLKYLKQKSVSYGKIWPMNMEKILTRSRQALLNKLISYNNIFIDAIHALDNMFTMYEALLKELRKRPQTNHLYLKERLEIYKYCIEVLISSQRVKTTMQKAAHTDPIRQERLIRRVLYTGNTA